MCKLAFHTSSCGCLFLLAHIQFVLTCIPHDPCSRIAAVFSSVACLCYFLPPNALHSCPSSLSCFPSLSKACQIPIPASKVPGVSRADFEMYSVLSFRSFMEKQSNSSSRADLSETLHVLFSVTVSHLSLFTSSVMELGNAPTVLWDQETSACGMGG